MLLTPFLIRRMGVAAYGLVPLISGIVNYCSVASVVLNVAAARHVSVAITHKRYEQAIQMFSTAFWGSAFLALLITAIGAAASWNAARLVAVPPHLEWDAKLLFATSALSTAVLLMAAPVSIAVQYTNRLDVKGKIDLATRLLYAAIAVVLVTKVVARPAVIGVALLASTTAAFAQGCIFWRRQLPWLRLRWECRIPLLREFAGFGAWTGVLYLGNLLFLQADVVIVNIHRGASESGIYAVVLQLPLLVRSLGSTVAVVLSQPMPHLYAKYGSEHVFAHAAKASKLMGVLVLMPVAVVAGCAEPLLRLWGGSSVAAYWPLLVLLTAHLGVTLATLPYVTALQAVMRVRVLGAVTFGAGILNVIAAVWLVRFSGGGLYSVAAAGVGSFILLSVVIVPAYAAAVFRESLWTIARPLGTLAIITVAACLVGRIVLSGVALGWIDLGARASILAVATGAAAGIVVLNGDEKRAIAAQLRSFIERVA